MKTVDPSIFFKEPNVSDWTRAVWDRELAKLIDELSATEFHIEPAALMETAGRAVAKLAIERGAAKYPVIVLCGQGNNGGDGLVAARILHDQGARVTVIILREPEKKPSVLFSKQLSTIEAIGVAVTSWSPGTIESLGVSRPIIIDAVSGLGFRAPCGGIMLQSLTEAAKLSDAIIIAVDMPSGMSSDDGTASTAPLPAHDTVTFASSRPIHRLMPSASCCGNITVADIGFPQAAVTAAEKQHPPIWREVEPHETLRIDPWSALPKNAHKYDRGHVLVIGGSTGKIGAPILAALAALRSGAGWCSIAIPRGEAPPDIQIPPELTVESFFDGKKIDALKLREFLESRKVRCVIVGPGWMGQCLDQESFNCMRDFAKAGGKIVFDAGALTGIATLIVQNGQLPAESCILTPHHGEWIKLQDISAPPPLTPDGVTGARKYSATLGAHIIYKNAAPVIVSPGASTPIICISGGPALARAGSGDLLTGMIAAHLAIGCSLDFAAARSYTLLARAAWMAAQEVGEDAVIASDIISRIGIANRL